jgi:outer membrane lipoprotein carrier protein
MTAEGTETALEIAGRVEDKYRDITSISFSFFQKTSGQLSGRQKTGKGNGIFAKRDEDTFMRWNYVTPERQVVISDGNTVSMYFEKLDQMIIAPMDRAQSDVLFSFFTAQAPLAENFEIMEPTENTPDGADRADSGPRVIELRPLDQQSQMQTIFLWVANDSLIRRIELIDHFDTRTEINLSNIIINPLDQVDRATLETLFTFEPPDGTEIIRQ